MYFFFVVYAQWKWPQPVGLTPIYMPPSDFELPIWMEMPEWTVNSTGQRELTVRAGGHVMPIITPVFPAHNATANVSESTLKVSSPLRALCPAHARTH